jgi:hypothetical protein
VTDAEGHRLKLAVGRALRNFGILIGVIAFFSFEIVALLGGLTVTAVGLNMSSIPITLCGLIMMGAGVFVAMVTYEISR